MDRGNATPYPLLVRRGLTSSLGRGKVRCMTDLMPSRAQGHYGILSAASDFRDILLQTMDCATLNQIDEEYIDEIIKLGIRSLLETGRVTLTRGMYDRKVYRLCQKDSK